MGDIMKKIKVVLFVLFLLLLIFIPKLLNKPVESRKAQPIVVPELIKVEIYGEVNLPGVYYVESGTTYEKLINYALGPKLEADLSTINLKEPILDSIRIEIKKKDEPVTQKVNINTASLEELVMLPSIGEATAKRIIEYRQKNGAFLTISDLKQVSGIGDQTFEKLKNLITV